MPENCEYEDCQKQASFGFPGEWPSRCAGHMLQGMENIKQKSCEHPSCTKRPSFNHPGEQRARYCNEHRELGMEDVVTKNRCEHPDSCKKRALFGLPGQRPSGCGKHALERMENVVAKRCEHSDCKKQPSFGFPGERAIRCAKHASEGMENVMTKRCEHSDCKKHPSFGFPGGRAVRCATHRLEGMEDVREHPGGCDKRALFGLPGQQPVRCKNHALEEMKLIVKKCCEHPDGCEKQPCFGHPGERPTRCFDHRSEAMENVMSKRCDYPGCNTQAHYGHKNGPCTRCAKHRDTDMEDFNAPVCRSENCITKVGQQSKYDGYCLTCFVYLFPEKEVSRNYKTKENEVATYVKSLNIDKEYLTTFDRIVQDGCSLRRPDIMIECVTHVVIVEVDEDQHRYNDCACENKRMMQIFQDLGSNRPVVFLRFNPDAYTDSRGKKQPSCFKFHKRLSVPLITDIPTWSNRLQVLKDRIMQHLGNVPISEITVEHLFYDGFH